jgi:hypothetical protein
VNFSQRIKFYNKPNRRRKAAAKEQENNEDKFNWKHFSLVVVGIGYS